MVGMTDLGQSSEVTTGDRTGYHARQSHRVPSSGDHWADAVDRHDAETGQQACRTAHSGPKADGIAASVPATAGAANPTAITTIVAS